MAVGRLADVLQPAGDQKAREQPGKAAAAVGVGVVTGGMAVARGACPADRLAAPRQGADIERTIDQHREIEAATGAELEGLDAATTVGASSTTRRISAALMARHAARVAGSANSSRLKASGGASFSAMSFAIRRTRRFSCASSWIGLSWPGSLARS